MKIDLEKKLDIADSFDKLIKISETYLDHDSRNNLRNYFDLLLTVEEDDASKEAVKLIDMLNRLTLIIPKRINRLLELNAPQVVVDGEVLALKSIKELNLKLVK